MKTKYHGSQKPYGFNVMLMQLILYGINVYVFLLEYLNYKEHSDG